MEATFNKGMSPIKKKKSSLCESTILEDVELSAYIGMLLKYKDPEYSIYEK